MSRLLSCLVALSLCWVASVRAGDVWREDSFADFADGTFGDAGANTYVSAAGRIQTVNRWDANGDGCIDILFTNTHPLIEMLNMSIYWGDGQDFSIRNHSYVPADGPMWVQPADLDGDGAQDLVVCNYSNGTWTSMDSFVYYGGPKAADPATTVTWSAYPFHRKTALPGKNTQRAAVTDLNKDGHPDIVFAYSGGFWEYRGSAKPVLVPSRVYWGDTQGFAADRFTDLPAQGSTCVATGDLDGDTWPDLAFANDLNQDTVILMGGPEGFTNHRRQTLPAMVSQSVKIADLNGDGAPDLLYACETGERSWAYLNQGGRFAPERRIGFETHTAKDCVVADFNRDGHADVFFSNHMHSLTGDPRRGNRMIDSYIYFGSPEGFSNQRRLGIETIGAWGANAADLNGDGWTDLLVCNFQEHYSYEVPSFIYWGGPEGFSIVRRTPLYEHGAQGNAIADFNGDGMLDVIITSMMGRSRGDYDPNYLYFGGNQGQYSPERRLELPGREAYEQAMADLDDDGQTDVLLMNQGEVTRHANELFIYWNQQNAFDPWRVTGLPAYRGLGVEVADLDRDGYLDIIVSNAAAPEQVAPADKGSFIYWGGPRGWSASQRTALDIVLTRSPAIADLNGDGHLDLAFGQQGAEGLASIFWGDGTRAYGNARRTRLDGTTGTGSPSAADLDKDGRLDLSFAHDQKIMVLYQSADSQFPAHLARTFEIQAKTMNIADVNGDGWLDLVCPAYKSGGRRSIDSTILLGGPQGFGTDRRIDLPTDGGTGSLVSDFNFDGYADVFFYCHRRDGDIERIGQHGDHLTDSFLYWGGPDGLRADRRLGIPGRGAHYDMGMDLGHIRDRSYTFDYISSPFDTRGRTPTSISWSAQAPPRCKVKFQMRAASRPGKLARAQWLGPNGPGSFYTTPGQPITKPRGRWIQYRAVLDTDNGASSPVLDAVEVTME